MAHSEHWEDGFFAHTTYSGARAGSTPALNALATVMLLFTLCAVAVAAFVLRSIRRRGGEPTGMAGGLTGLSG